MHILVMAMNYFPERTAIGPLNADLCEHLVSQGHQVSVVTAFPHYPEWKVAEPYRGKVFLRERINGVSVHRGYVYVPGKRSTVRRMLYDSSVAISAFMWGLTIRNVDVILAVSPPLQLDLAAYALSRMKQATFLLEVQDLVPDIAVALGMLKNRLAIKLARTMERFIYRKARAIVVICKGFAENLVSKGVPDRKLAILPNWVDTNFIRPSDRNNEFRRRQGLSEQNFLVLYTGNMGVKQKLENVIDAAKRVRDPNVVFLFAGDGSEKLQLEAYAAGKGLSNVRFLPLQPKDIWPQMFSAADVLVLNQAASVVDMVTPTKLKTYMAAGRPVGAGVHESSETARLIREADCGLVVAPEDTVSLAQAICRLNHDLELRERLGANGRRFAEQHFARDGILKKYGDFFCRVGEQFGLESGNAIKAQPSSSPR